MRIDRAELAAAMVRKDLTVKKLSEQTGLSVWTISAVRAGKRCSENTGKALVAVFGERIVSKEE